MAVVKKRGQSGLCGASARRGSHALHRRLEVLVRTALVLAIGTGLPAMAPAGDAPGVQPSLHDGRQPALVRAKNGIPVVNIVAPGKQGVSHNTYTRLDVGQQGLIFNNGADISKTQLAGYVTGNAHLAASGSARIILNEVVSTRASQLDGYMEVAGTPAELVIANPNGITCAGCGFLNTPRAVLTTGTPVIDGNGRLSGFKVTQGRINLRGTGLDASHIDRVDLLARAVDVNAELWAQRLNVVAGANHIAYGNLAATPIDGTGDKPGVAIDVAALGGMYANAIRLVGTEAGVGVNIEGETAAQAGDFTLTSAGKVRVDGRATATGIVTVGAAQSVDVDGVLASGGSMDVHGHALDLAGTVYSDKDITLAADGGIRNQGQVQAGKSLSLTAASLANGGKLYALGGPWHADIAGAFGNAAEGDIYAADTLTLTAQNFDNAGGLEAVGTLKADILATLTNRGVMQSDQAGLILDGNRLTSTGALSAAGDMTLAADAGIDASGTVVAGGNLSLAGAAVTTGGTLEAGKAATLTSRADLDNTGTVQAGGALAIDAGGNLANEAGGLIHGNAGVTLEAGGDLDNAGTVYASGGLGITAATLHNANVLRSAAGVDIEVAGAAGNTGTVYGLAASQWQVGGALDNTGVLASAGDTTVAAASLNGDGTLAAGLASDGTLGQDGDLKVTTRKVLQATGRNLAAGNLHLSGSALQLAGSQDFAGGDAALAAGAGDIGLAGATLAAHGVATFTASGRLVNGGTGTAEGGQIGATSLRFEVAAIDNDYGTIEQTGDADLSIDLAGAFDNAHGTFAVNAGNLTLAAATLNNAAGNLQHAGDGRLTLASTGWIDNTGGTIAGNGTLTLHAGGTLDNATGTIGVLQAATVQAATFDNTGGTLAASGLAVTVTGQVDNTGGTLASTAALHLAAGSLVNGIDGAVKTTGDDALAITLTGILTNASGAFLGGNGEVGLQAAQLGNAGQLYAGGDLSVTTTDGGLDNTGGQMQAMGSLVAASATRLINASGTIEAGADNPGATLAVHAASVDNHAGRLANAGAGDTTLSIGGAVDNRGGTLGGQGDVQVDAASLANGDSGKLVAGRDLGLTLASLDNASGTVYAARNLAWSHHGATLGNAGGSVGAGGDLALALGRVDNTGGNLDAGNDVALTLARLDGEGRIAAGHDLGLALSGDYTNGSGNTLEANHDLSLTVGGSFDNAAGATLEAVHALAVHAAGITNVAGAAFHSATTTLVATHDLDNQGGIEGDNIGLTAATLTNSGNIMGGAITVHAGTLTNGTDLGTATDNTPYQTALIASTDRLDLYVTGTLLNQDASLFTMGDMTLAKNVAGDRSSKIINRSGDIEADGNLFIAANQIINERRYYRFQTFPVSGNTIVGWTGDAGSGSGVANTITKSTPIDLEADPLMSQTCHSLPSDWRCDPDEQVQRVDTWTVTSATVLTATSAESRILANGDIALSGSLTNDASTLSAGNNLVINQVQQSGDTQTGTVGGESVRNIARAPTVGVQHMWKESITEQRKGKCGGYTQHCWSDRGPAVLGPVYDTEPLPDGDYSFVTLDLGPTLSARITAGNRVDIQARDIDNTVVDADGHPVKGAIALGSNSQGRSVSGEGVQGVDDIDRGGASGSNVSLGSAPTGMPVAPNAPQTVAGLTGPDAHVALPQSGLYTIHKNPDSSYLVETDPRFANYANFLSSDYMLDHLGYDPAAVDKRLGDGFYEQRQVLDQITQLTGRRFLTADTDAMDQYRALMDNAVEVADTFHLSVGVALTPAQMAGLTRDIVWLVKEDVDGQSVLVPVVYLSRKHAQQLTMPGAVIAGRNVVLDATGDIDNNGILMARQSATLKADNLLNRGTLTAGDALGIQAAHDILNRGGILQGADVSLVAGHDVVSRADIGAVNIGGVNLGEVNVGSITATHNLSVLAGRDVSLDAVPIKAGDTLQLAAGRDFTATASHLTAGRDLTVLAGRDVSLDATHGSTSHGDAHHFTTTTTHHVTHLDAGHTLTVAAGRDLVSHGATLQGGNTLNLAAGHNLTLAAVTDHTHTFRQWKHGHTSGTTITDDDTLHGTTLAGTRGVTLSAGHDATLVAADVASDKGDVTVQAGHDIHLDAGHEEHDWSQDTRTHHHSLLSSSTTTTHDATQDNLAIGTTLSGDAVKMVAAHDLTTHAAQIAGTHDVNLLAGHNLSIGTGKNHHAEQYSITKKKSGVFSGGGASGLGGIGFTVGSQKAGATSTIDQHTTTGSLIGSTQGNVTLAAGGDLSVIGSDLIAGRAKGATTGGNIALQGSNVTLTSAAQIERDTNTQHHSQHGMSMALVGTAPDGIKDVRAMRHEQAGSGKKTEDTLRAVGAMLGDTPGVAVGYGSHSSSQSSQFDATTQRGSSARAAGNLAIHATGGDLTVIGSALSAGGKATLAAKKDVDLLASVDTQSQSHQSHSHGKSYTLAPISGGDVARHLDGGANHSGVSMSPYNSKTSDADSAQHIVNETGTTLSAGQIAIVSHQGDITTQGAQLGAQGNIHLLASQGNITLGTGTASQSEQNHSKTHSIGDQGGDGYSGTIGERQEQHDQQGQQTTQSDLRTALTSTNGDVSVIAHGDLTGQGVDIAGRDVTLMGKDVILTPSQDTRAQKQHSHVSQFGVTLALSGVAVQAAQAADAAVAAHDNGNNRLAVLYAAEAAYGAKDSKAAVAGKSSADLVKVTVSIGGSHQTSDSASQSTTEQGSTIKASHDLTIVATGDGTEDTDGYAANGDILMQGAQVSAGRNARLAAARDIDLIASQDTSQQTQHHQAGSASIGVGFGLGGEQNGFTLELAAAAARGKGKGNGTTYTATQLTAGDTLSLTSGRDTTLEGAQAQGQTLLADVGRNLTLTSTQDTNHYTEKDQSASAGLSLCIPPFCYGTSSGGASYNQTNIRDNYRSVTDQTGLAAGSGGFQIHVGGTTALTGATLASTADASKNRLDTGNLTIASLHNVADSSASQEGATLNSGGSLGSNLTQNTVGAALNLAIPQGGKHSSDTKSRIAQVTIAVRNYPDQGLSGLDRDASALDGHGVANNFDLGQIKENQSLGQAAGYVGMRTVGMIAEDEADKAAADFAKAQRGGDKSAQAAAEARMKAWGAGGVYRTTLHGLVGAATAALGGGNALQGALGATASEAASGAMQQYLVDHHIDPDSTKGKSLMDLASTAIGATVGQGTGAATALQGEKYNRQLHDDEKVRIKALADGDPLEEAKLTAAACYLVHCAAQYPKNSAAHAYFSKVEALGSQLISEQALLKQQSDTHYIYVPSLMRFGPQVARRKVTTSLFDYSGGDAFSDGAKRLNSTYSLTTRVGGLLQATGGTATMVTGGLGFVAGGAACPESLGAGCAVAIGSAGLAAWGADEAQAGWSTLRTGTPTRTFGGEVIQNVLGTSPQTAELLYGLVGGAGDLAAAGKTLLDSAADFSRSSALLRVSSDKFLPNGITPNGAVMSTPTAKAMVKDIMAGTQGMTKQQAEDFAAAYIESGSTFPMSVKAAKDTVLYKVIPKGASVREKSGFWMTASQLEALAGKSPAEIADLVGLPAKQAHKMIENGIDVYAITAKQGQTEVFVSKVAKTSQGDVDAKGGVVQTIVPNRSQWSTPEKQNATDWLGKQQTLSGTKQRSAFQITAGAATATGSRLNHTQAPTAEDCSQSRPKATAEPTCVEQQH